MSPEDVLAAAIARALATPRTRPLVLGMCGAQGSGKSTLAEALAARFPGAVTLSIDDLYRTRAERERLAATVHPLFATRGVPGTHDVALGRATFAALDRGEATALPRFSKEYDDRVTPAAWPVAPPGCPLVIFEGWCVGARPQSEPALAEPINALERDHDANGVWRRHANAALAGAYQLLFDRIDLLALLRAPDWDQVYAWRRQQEDALRRSGARGTGVMDDDRLRVFVSHYERLTRHILAEMPGRADWTFHLDADRRCIAWNGPPDA